MMENTAKFNANSCVETPAAPDWLSKLEHRREHLMRGKLGHEAGAGAPCNECGDKCPGLDLHFWRKVCRNCKCRKDQHSCVDEDLSGWAQFEILGQIRSKPAYIKIKALANQSVRLDWVPPNATPDVVSDYMDKLGTTQIPIAGSNAAAKRKQQLEFQVPPHDLDVALCDNLSESEANQLLQYVQKIRENCVGQGNVVRVGRYGHALKGHIIQANNLCDDSIAMKPEYVQVMEHLNELPVSDPLINDLMSCEKLQKAIVSDTISEYPKVFVAFAEPISETPMQDWHIPTVANLVSQPTMVKIRGLNKMAIQSLVQNGIIYDKILGVLKEKNFDFSRDPKLSPINDFRNEYLKNPQFKKEIDELFMKSNSSNTANFVTPIKFKPPITTPLNSPLALKNPVQARFGAQMKQETPMRKVKFGSVSTLIYDLGLPSNVDYDKDTVFSQIINSEPLKQAFQYSKLGKQPRNVVVSLAPMKPDFLDEPILSPKSKHELNKLAVDAKCLQSALLNGPFYDRLFETLDEKDIDYGSCPLLTPVKQLRNELLHNPQLNEEAREFVSQLPQSLHVAYGCPQNLLKNYNSPLRVSKSSDSGFDSKPSTPNYSTHPGLLMGYEDLNAAAGKFSTIPGIEDMNMYPEVQPCTSSTILPNALQNLHLSEPQPVEIGGSVQVTQQPTLNCRDCQRSIALGEVAVKAERAGKEIAWHPECFKCHSCRELLADLVYFFHGGQVYCGRDLAIKLKIPRCKACDELIFTKEYTAAEGSTFHIKHFCCYQCDTPLAGQQYIPDERSNMPLCLKCYNEFFAAACQRCQHPIGPADQGVAWGEVHWHGPCFVCAGANCGRSLIGGRFCVKENMPFCSPACVRSIIR